MWLPLSVIGLRAQSAQEIEQYQKSRVVSKSLFERISASPARPGLREFLASQYRLGRADVIAFEAMGQSSFYQSFLKTFFSPLLNTENSEFIELNDAVATAIGLVRDNIPFNEVFFGNYFYTGSDGIMSFSDNDGDLSHVEGNFLIRNPNLNGGAPVGHARPVFRKLVDSRVQYRDNLHYEELERVVNWSSPEKLVQRPLVDSLKFLNLTATLELKDTMGVFTTRQTWNEYLLGGTNRRPIGEIFENWLCKPLEQLHDWNLPTDLIRQDIDRQAGGDANTFVTNCAGCHAGMDALAGAFTFLDFRAVEGPFKLSSPGALESQIPKLFRQDSIFPDGHRVVDDSWQLYWHTGPNAALGWREPQAEGAPNGPLVTTSGHGPNSLGKVLAASEAFSECMAQQVFQKVCSREPNPQEANELKAVAREFETGIAAYDFYGASHPYSFKALIARTTNVCAYGSRQGAVEGVQ